MKKPEKSLPALLLLIAAAAPARAIVPFVGDDFSYLDVVDKTSPCPTGANCAQGASAADSSPQTQPANSNPQAAASSAGDSQAADRLPASSDPQSTASAYAAVHNVSDADSPPASDPPAEIANAADVGLAASQLMRQASNTGEGGTADGPAQPAPTASAQIPKNGSTAFSYRHLSVEGTTFKSVPAGINRANTNVIDATIPGFFKPNGPDQGENLQPATSAMTPNSPASEN